MLIVKYKNGLRRLIHELHVLSQNKHNFILNVREIIFESWSLFVGVLSQL